MAKAAISSCASPPGIQEFVIPQDSRQQLDWVDVCKGLGIYLVVLGHCNVSPALHRFIYTFHMPLFFCLSGYLHRTDASLLHFAKAKAIRLLLPYSFFLLLLYPLKYASILAHHGWNRALFLSALWDSVWGGNRLHFSYGVFWFLTCLFFTQQLMNYLLVRFRPVAVGFLVGAGCLAGYANAFLAPNFFLPLDLNIVAGAMPFFYLGYLTRRSAPPRGLSAILSVLGTACAGLLAYFNQPAFYDMRDAIYGVPGLSLVLSCCCVVCLAAVSHLCVAVRPLRAVLVPLGGASMGVMFIHKALLGAPGMAGWPLRHGYFTSLLVTAISFGLTWSLRQSAWTHALFLGSESQLRKLLLARQREPLPPGRIPAARAETAKYPMEA